MPSKAVYTPVQRNRTSVSNTHFRRSLLLRLPFYQLVRVYRYTSAPDKRYGGLPAACRFHGPG